MPQMSSTSAIGILSIALAIFAVIFEPSRQILFHKAAELGIVPPTFSSSPAAGPIVHDAFRDIKYVGSTKAGVEHFQNIFYAEDTSGKNRFAPPVKFLPKAGTTVDATKPGAWCPQATGDVLPFTSKVTDISENCLSLRVARANGTKPDAKLPVIVYLHGGGHALGSGYEILYEPDGLIDLAAEQGEPVIWVAINYRLGFFGFATSQALIDAKHTNAGLRDQRAALEWVQENIAAFGGDPAQVTVIGQSVGANDIGLQLLAHGGKRGVPFSRAVMISGGPGLNFNTKSDLVKNNTASVAEQVGCVQNGDAQSAATLACLRKAPADKLTELSVTAMRAARPPFGEGFFYPTEDGDLLLDRPSELLRAGKVAQGVPLIASWTTNDGAWYASPTMTTDEEVLASFGLWLTGLSEETKAELLKLYPLKDFAGMVRPEIDGPISPQYYRAAQMNKDFWFTCPVLDFTWQYSKHGGVDVNDIHLYEHNATRFGDAFKNMGVPMWRVAHLSDVPYILNNQVVGDNSTKQLSLSKIISRNIRNFVVSGSAGLTFWPAAYSGVSQDAVTPDKLSVKLHGGAWGVAPTTISKNKPPHVDSEPEKALHWEKLFERCEFINSAKVREETGV